MTHRSPTALRARTEIDSLDKAFELIDRLSAALDVAWYNIHRPHGPAAQLMTCTQPVCIQIKEIVRAR